MQSGLEFENDPGDDVPDDAFGAALGPMPTVSSKVNWEEVKIDETMLCDLWIVGCGTLGKLAAKQWLEANPADSVIAETKSDASHATLTSEIAGVFPRTRDARDDENDFRCARNVLVCIPPSSAFNNEVYEQELYQAFRLWAGPTYGNFVFTSSTAVYGDSFGNTVNEGFRVDSRTKRSASMISAEEAVSDRGGTIVRLAGLYSADRGPHTFWLKRGSVEADPDGLVNMLHYEDAASVCLAAIRSSLRGQVYLASDDRPMSRQQICEAALVSGRFPDATMPTFVPQNSGRAKQTDCSWTRDTLNWAPKYASLPTFMYSLAGKKYELEEKVNSSALLLDGFGEGDDLDFTIEL